MEGKQKKRREETDPRRTREALYTLSACSYDAAVAQRTCAAYINDKCTFAEVENARAAARVAVEILEANMVQCVKDRLELKCRGGRLLNSSK